MDDQFNTTMSGIQPYNIPNCYIWVNKTGVEAQANKCKIEDKELQDLIGLGAENPHTAGSKADQGIVMVKPSIAGTLTIGNTIYSGFNSMKLKHPKIAWDIYCFEAKSKERQKIL